MKSFCVISDIAFAHFIAPVIRKRGFMKTGEVIDFIRENYELSEDALEPNPSTGEARWIQIVRNMKSNKVFYKYPELGVIHADKGFAKNNLR